MAKKTAAKSEPLSQVTEIDPEARKELLEKTLKEITKRFGEGAIMRMGEAQNMNVEVIPTGCLTLDLALGVGGIPRGRITEIYGPESSGKTTLCLHVVAEAQKRGGTCAFIDMEHAMDPSYAHKLGVNINELLVAQPDTGEQALEIADELVRSCAVDVIIVDSVAALVPKGEIEGDMGDATMGAQARLISQALRKLSGAINQTKTAVIFTNQLRQKIGVMFGNPETTPGGLAMKYYSTIRIDIRRQDTIKRGGEIIGNHARARVVKNKVAPPFAVAEFDIIYGEGIDKVGDILELAVRLDIVNKRGAFFSYKDTRLGQGREKTIEFLNANPELLDEIEAEVRDFANSDDEGLMTFSGDDDDSEEKGPQGLDRSDLDDED